MRKMPATTGRPKAQSRRPSEVGNVPPSEAEFQAPTGRAAAATSKTLAASGPKSLMKTSELGAGRGVQRHLGSQSASSPASPSTRRKPAPSKILSSQQQKIEERIAAATEELSAGVTEAATAAEELRRSMEQIASGAEEAASAAQETLAVAANTAASLVQARDRAEGARRRTEAVESLLLERRARSEPGRAISSITATGRPEPSISWRN